MIKVWYHPDDPRFEDVDLADDAVPGNDGRPETVTEETAAAIVAIAENELAREADEQPAYPSVIVKIIYDFRECYNERSRQHRLLAELGETNTQAVCAERKDIIARIGCLSKRMTLLAAVKSSLNKTRNCLLKNNWTNSIKRRMPLKSSWTPNRTIPTSVLCR